jgi:serine protease
MKSWQAFVVVVCVVLLAYEGTAGARAGGVRKEGRVFSQHDQVVPGVVIVKLMPSVVVADRANFTSIASLNRVLDELGVIALEKIFTSLRRLSESDVASGSVDLSLVYYAYIPEYLDPREVARQLDAEEGVEYAEPKFMNFLNDTPNDPLLSNQTSYFTRMNLFNGWTIAKGDTSVYIGVVDGGTFWPHEDLQPNYRFGWNFANNTNDPRGLAGTPNSAAHGTATASHFGARTDNGIGIAGSSWNCSIVAINAASPTTDNAIQFGYEGIVFAYTNGAKVINCSWGRTGGFSLFEQDVINAATQSGALVVVAAGNGTNNNGTGKSNDLAPDYPPSYKNTLAVGATSNTSDSRASFSNYGRTVPVFAPGVSIYGCLNGGGYGNNGSGTSFASPLVAGLAGIIKSYRPAWTPRQIALQLKTTCDSIDGANPSLAGNLGRGRVNLARALSESHAGIEILSADIRTPSGSTLFLQNDTIVVTLTVKNILFTSANNLVFTATSSSGSVTVLQGTVNAGTLAPDEQVTLTPFRFRVGTLSVSTDVALRLDWVSNGNDRDSWAYKVTVFPAIPLWETQASPTTTSLYSVKPVNQNIVWASGGTGTGTPVVVRTTNGGVNWTDATGTGLSGDLYCIAALDADRAWVGALVGSAGKIYATTNGGVTWAEQVYPGTQSPFINGVWMFPSGLGYAQGDPATSPAGRFIVLRTTNFGQTWSHLASEPVGSSTEAGWNNSFWWTSETNGWFGTNNNKVWRTTDGGASWASSATGVTNSYVVVFKDNSNGLAGHSTGAIRMTTNGGSSWNTVTSPTTQAINGAAYVSNTGSAWVSATSIPYRSTNNGTNWTSQTLYPFSGSIYHLAMYDTTVGWLVTSNGEILKYRPQGTTAVEPPGMNAPLKYALEQNYPNPFNPTTTIRYEIRDAGNVQLKVYDVLGREVAELVNERQDAGSHRVNFNAARLASGVYFYRLSAGGFTETRRMLLMK